MAKAPTDLAELRVAITENHETLSKRLRQVAQYLLDNTDKIAFGTVAIIAQDAGVHPSTMVRFANAFGFSGFTEMQRLFQQQLTQDSLSYGERIRVAKAKTGNELESPITLLEQFNEGNSNAMDMFINQVDEAALNDAVDLMLQASSVHLMGVRRSSVIALYLAYAIRHVGKRAFLLDGIGGLYSEQSGCIEKEDVLVAVSFYPYGQETQDVIAAAVDKGVKVILITDSQISPNAQLAEVCFTVRESEVHGFRSLTTSFALAQSLAIVLASRLENPSKL